MGTISRKEFRKSLSSLRQQGLSKIDIKNLKNAASGHFDRDSFGLFGGGKSMNKKEVDTLITYLKENPSRHYLSKSQIQKTETKLREDLKD
jgi:hypothetical protein